MPAAVVWFKIYAACMALLYVLVIVLGALFLINPAWLETENVEARIMGVVFVGLGIVLAAVYGAAIVLPRRSWVWVYDLVLIAIGFMSCCILPFSVVLLIFWLKPEVKTFFNRA
jgi:hypothetical protein